MNDTERLVDTVDRFCQFITTLPASALIDSDWGPKEVLAHLVYHHERYVDQVEAFLAGQPVRLFHGRFREMNAEAVVASRGKTPAELTDRFRRANQRLAELYQQRDPDQIRVQIKEGGKLWTLAELLPRVEAHIRNHLEKLRKDFKA